MAHIYQEIAESIRRLIASGELEPGDRLPAVRELAQQWHCTPGTVNRAYQELADQGLVSGHRGGGTRILENPLQGNRPNLEWAGLVNKAEGYLLEVLSGGYSADQAQSALAVAISRWQTLQKAASTDLDKEPATGFLRFAGSHDLTVEILASKLLETKPNYRMELEFIGSLGGLISLARSEADLAGVHLWDAATDSYNLPFIQRILPNRRLGVVTLIYRQFGFIVPEGNPQQIQQLEDLTRMGVRLINRQPGSGTRIWLDEHLQRVKIKSSHIDGYGLVGATHMAVAQAVQTGQATVGLGIQAAALAYGHDFIPLTEELYQLVVPEVVWENPIWQAILGIIRSDRFETAARDLGGYNTSATGEVIWI